MLTGRSLMNIHRFFQVVIYLPLDHLLEVCSVPAIDKQTNGGNLDLYVKTALKTQYFLCYLSA